MFETIKSGVGQATSGLSNPMGSLGTSATGIGGEVTEEGIEAGKKVSEMSFKASMQEMINSLVKKMGDMIKGAV